uniref:Molybdopterin-guanine dinucleotide biosynthesis protein A n=1 Tax=uncultured organism TaxID=155900 RepID=M1Q310_9ZZZZ|nr:molybdopterin-guanine dinucleotide biosynthesis protein A [uncultured organism]
MHGINKSFLTLKDTTFLEILIQTLRPLFSEILLVTREPHLYREFDINAVLDTYSIQCSLAGIHAGLSHASHSHAFMVACDTPLLQPAMVSLLLQELDPLNDVVVPRRGDYYEPLCAVYSKSCIRYIEDLIQNNDLKITRLYNYVKLKEITAKKLETADPNLESFVNINTPGDLEWLNLNY